jgi:UDP-4-amino-4,6-dideoxy-N-acetyl-beta-L-altrosamine transaminase
MALDVGPGDLVWTSPITFVASANCARYCGADVDFVDIDPRTFNMSPERLAEKLAVARKAGRLPKVVIPVNMCGQSADMAAIHALGKEYGFRIIEDACHAIGGSYKRSKIGSSEYSDITVLSFHPVKIITTGEGGMAMTNDEGLQKRMTRLRSHGVTRYASDMTGPPDGSWYYQQLELGYNYRMTDIQAALGLSQMKRLDEFVQHRHALVANYQELLAGHPVEIPWQHPDVYSSFHLYVIRVKTRGGAAMRREIFERMRASGIGVNVHYIPVYRQPYYGKMGFRPSDFPAAESYYAEAITLPLYPNLTRQQQEGVVRSLTVPAGYQTLF